MSVKKAAKKPTIKKSKKPVKKPKQSAKVVVDIRTDNRTILLDALHKCWPNKGTITAFMIGVRTDQGTGSYGFGDDGELSEILALNVAEFAKGLAGMRATNEI